MSYAGDLTPRAAFDLLISIDESALVDVRTAPELAFVGAANLSLLGKQVHHVEWQRYPDGRINEQFIDDLIRLDIAREDPVLFLCRSGNRSAHAARAATRAGYAQAYNVAHGFEGPLDHQGRRGTISGWKADGLPWRQS